MAAAREAISEGADAVVEQGSVAGGHQSAQGAGIISLVPKIKDIITSEFPEKVAVF